MSSSDKSKAAQKKPSRVGPPAESASLKKLKADKRAEQEARTVALLTHYDTYRSNVLAQKLHEEVKAACQESSVVDLTADLVPPRPDCSTEAGCWYGERRTNGIVLSRGFGETLRISESSVRPGEWKITFEPPIPEYETLFPGSSAGPE